MTITINIKCDNAAFHDDNVPNQGPEVARILRKLASSIEEASDLSDHGDVLHDLNGNRVGEFNATR